jgi:phage tail sheath protein FI
MNTVNPSAGVYTNELDLSQRVQAVGSSIGAIVGAFEKGPVGERTLITDNADFREMFGNPNPKKYDFTSFCGEAFLAESDTLYVTRVANGALTAGAYLTADDASSENPILSITNFDDGSNVPLGADSPMENLGFNPGDADVDSTLLFIVAHNPGEWNNKISVRIRPSNPAGRAIGTDHDTRHFYIDVYYDYTGPRNVPVESFLVSRRLGEINGNGQPLFVEEVINRNSKYIKVKNNPYCAEMPIVASPFEFLAGGIDGQRVTLDQVANGWDLYEDGDVVDVNILINAGYASPIVQRKMVEVAELRQDALAVLDVPFADFEIANAVNYRRNTLNINSSYGAMYGPWLQIRDTFNNKKLYVPASGHVAAAYAKTDSDRALWFAPAGLARGQLKVLGVKKKYNQGARDALDRAQINAVRFMPGRGYVIWGQNTLQTFSSSTENVNVRRLVNFIKKSIATAATVGVFDPNDEFLRLSLRSISESFLKPIKNGRGLYAYDVVCDERNNKPDIIANGDIILDVFADPVIPAKRIHLTAHVQPTGTYFNEG